jgi:Ca-activated chloride channel family protein
MKNRHYPAPLALLLLLALLLSACGGSNTSSGGGADYAASEPQDEAAQSGAAERQEAPEVGADGAAAPPAEMEEMAMEDVAEAEMDAATEGMAAPPEPNTTGATAPPPTLAATQAPPDQDDRSAPEEEPAPPPMPTPAEVEINPFTRTVDDSLSTFAMDVDTASYSAARGYLNRDTLPPPQTVRVEEFVNYFDYRYPNPAPDTFGVNVAAAPSPFGAAETYFVRVGIQGERIEASERDNAALTFVIDISGSMSEPNRLPLVKESLSLLVEQLREGDTVAIVVYSDRTRTVLEPTSVTERERILDAINSLRIEGSTNVEAGLRLGYEVAQDNFVNGAINRVILCSDGLANVGATDPDAIRNNVREYAEQGVLLTTVGFGMQFNDNMMETLANDGNGNYAYVDTLDEARRVFVENLTGTLQVIARDAKIQVEFNPDVVSQYRLLGYENRDVADADFRNDDVDAGEVGAGDNVTALYEVRMTEQGSGTALTAQIRYEDPETGEVYETATPLESSAFAGDFAEAPADMQLAVAVAGLAEHLRGSGYAQDRPLSDILTIAERVAPQFANDDDVQEFVGLVQQTQEMSP